MLRGALVIIFLLSVLVLLLNVQLQIFRVSNAHVLVSQRLIDAPITFQFPISLPTNGPEPAKLNPVELSLSVSHTFPKGQDFLALNSSFPEFVLVRGRDEWGVKNMAFINSSTSESSSNPLIVQLGRVLQGCGQICDTSMKGKAGKFFNQIEKKFDCHSIWSNAAIDEPRPPGVAPDIPRELLNLFLHNGKFQFKKMPLLINNSPSTEETARRAYFGATALMAVWKKDTIDTWSELCKNGNLRGNYGFQSTRNVFEGLQRTPGVNRGNVLVIGSENPWVEACVLSAGARHVTTLEYGKILSQHPQVSTVLPSELRSTYLNGSMIHFDAIVTFSSVEHSGLGRYGDQLNPWGDMQAIARSWCLCKSGGGLLLGVMESNPDRIEWNQHRRYGLNMFPHLTANWVQVWQGRPDSQRIHVFSKQGGN